MDGSCLMFVHSCGCFIFFFKQKTAYEMRISDWSSDVCSSDLSVIASESYTDFVGGLQKEIAESLSARPRKASQAYFAGKQLQTPEGPVTVTDQMATQIHRYLIKNDSIDASDQIPDVYHTAKADGTLATLDRKSVVEGKSVSVRLNHCG